MRRYSLLLAYLPSTALLALVCLAVAPEGNLAQARTSSSLNQSPGGSSSTPPTQALRGIGPYKSREDNGTYSRIILQNDLTVFIKEHHAFPLAAVSIRISIAGLAPTARNEILLHLAAMHLFYFNDPDSSIPPFDAVEALGGLTRVHIVPDALEWSATFAPEHVSSVLSLLASRLKSPSISLRTLSAALSELAGRGQDSESRNLFLLAGFPSSFEWPAEATPELLESLASFLKQTVTAPRLTVALVGDLDREKVIQQASRLLLPLSAGAPKSLGKDTPEDLFKAFRFFSVPTSEGLARWTFYSALPSLRPETEALLTAFLVDGEMSVLRQALMGARGWAIHLDSQSFTVGARSGIQIEITCRADRLDEVAAFLFARLRQSAAVEPTNDEMHRARQQYALRWNRRHQAPAALADDLIHIGSSSEWTFYLNGLLALEKVTPEEIQKAAASLLNLEHAAVIEHWPGLRDPRSFSASTYKEFLALAVPRTIARLRKKTEQAGTHLVSLPTPTKTPGAQEFDRTQLKPTGWKKYAILRGPDVYVNEFHPAPLVTLAALYPGGNFFEADNQKSGLTALAVTAAIQSIRNKDHEALWFQLESLGATVLPIAKEDIFGYVLLTPPASAQSAVDLFIAMLLEPEISADDVKSAESQLLEQWRAELESPSTFAADQLKKSFFRFTHFYKPLKIRMDAVSKAQPPQVVEWWNTLQKETPPTVLIFGDTEGTELVAAFAKKMSSSRWKTSALQGIASLQTPAMPALLTESFPRTGALGGWVGFAAQNFSTPNAAGVDVGRWLFKDLFSPSHVSEFHYLRYFIGERPLDLKAAPMSVQAISNEISARISHDAAVAAAQRIWKTEREVFVGDSLDFTLNFFRRSLHFPNLDALLKAEQDSLQFNLGQIKEALAVNFRPQNMMLFTFAP